MSFRVASVKAEEDSVLFYGHITYNFVMCRFYAINKDKMLIPHWVKQVEWKKHMLITMHNRRRPKKKEWKS